MYERTYLDKFATIVKGSDINTGFNPIGDLLCGRNKSRILLHFDESKVKSMVESKVYPDMGKLRHTLHITNAGSLDLGELHNIYASKIDAEAKRRASSVDLIFFLIPGLWDNGKGFDFTKNYFEVGKNNQKSFDYERYKITEGVTWYNMRQGVTWRESIKNMETVAQLFHFFVTTDKVMIGGTGATVTFKYSCECEGSKANAHLEFEAIDNVDGLVIGEPVHFAKNGQICYTEEHKMKYSSYVKQTVTFPENPLNEERRVRFHVKLAVNGKMLFSNPYTIKQLSKTEKSYPQTNEGVYSTEGLRKELEKFEKGLDSIVIGKQHVDIGNENIELDVTDVFNKFISGELTNYGIGIAYSPDIEDMESLYENYIGLIGPKTNSFYEPYVETTYEDVIHDDRTNFVVGKHNKLYFYANMGGDLFNLDEMPVCTIGDTEYEVKQAGKGIYYIDICLPIESYTSPIMLYDVWSNIKYKGVDLPDVELDFTTQSPYKHFSIGTNLPEDNEFSVTAYGVQNNEQIKRDNKDLRKINFLVRRKYQKNTGVNIDGIFYRLYVKDGTEQITVIDYTEVNKAFNESYFMLDTSILIPETYYIDVKAKYGMEEITHEDVVHFNIIQDNNNKFE